MAVIDRETDAADARVEREALIREARERQRRRRSRGAAAIVALLAVVGGGIAMVSGGGAPVVPAGGGPIPAGATKSPVASPVSVRLVTAKHYCFIRNSYTSWVKPTRATDLRPYLPCNGPVPANEIRATDGPTRGQGTDVVFSWIARQPTSPTSSYQFWISLTTPAAPGCSSGQGGSIIGSVSAGERLTRAIFLPDGCTGTFTGTVYYDPRHGMRIGMGILPILRDERSGVDLPVGHFTITVPPPAKHG